MRTAIRVGAALVVAAAGIAVSQGTSTAEPAGHQVRYTLTAGGPADFDLFYLTAQPPNKQAYNADAYSFVKKEVVNVGPEAPWVFETTLAAARMARCKA